MKHAQQYRRLDRPDLGKHHEWAVIDILNNVAVHLWICEHTDSAGRFRPYGGVEFHYGTRPYYAGVKPSHDHCHLLVCPCWHEGSSLMAEPFISEFLQMGELKDSDVFSFLRTRLPVNVAAGDTE